LTALAEPLGVSRETVRLWELGISKPSDRHLDSYLGALEILGGDGTTGARR
jgi:DNA-binding transcriptional regulator YiaG